ncbi:hypothetical protein POM88_021715 [Heracleum sosnowskyi]|uniref:Uncharacterized protein n=1 Tax=Heracleum sosnowskyi TaxID=360622 RepID=A0AAD8IHE5_9APIA|nr:hypothetical protein POM88_021715 [Heracleum sosnowskyi]
MTENRNVVYFARFCQLIFSLCVDGVEIAEEDVILSFKLHKRIFSDLTNKDIKKGNVGDLMLPASVQQFLNPQPLLNSEPLPSTSQKPRAGGRTKHRAFKADKAATPANADDLPHSVGTSRKKKRANRPSNDENRVSDEPESANAKKRKLVAAYLFDGLIPGSTPVETPEVVIENHSANATVPEEARANTDDNAAFPDDFLEPILEMDIEDEIEAHPSISVCDTEDVAADQPTLVIDESLATHTEVLSLNNQVPEMGEEVDQVLEAVVEMIDEAIAEDIVKPVPEETEVFATANSEHVEVVEKSVPVEAEVLVNPNSENPEAAQPNTEATAENVAEENEAANSEHSFHANSNINAEVSNSDESIPFLRDPTAEHIKENVNATEAHYRDMTADFIAQSAKEITNSELLSHFKATIVQVKSLHNLFDETHKVVLGLSNDIALKELALKKDRAQFSSLIKDQETMKQRLTNVESNQAELSTKIDSIAASLELLTSVLIPDDVKKGERVPKDKCKRTPTLRLRDDANDGGSKEAERRSKTSQEQGRLRSNSARQTNSESHNGRYGH